MSDKASQASEPERPRSDGMVEDGDGSLDPFFDSMRLSTAYSSHPVRLLVNSWLLDESRAPESYTWPEPVITIAVRVTYARVIMLKRDDSPDDYYEYPEFEFEGWLVGDYPRTIWIRGALRGNNDSVLFADSRSFTELTVYRLKQGEELGTAYSPGIH
jgi:hypothetical protein